MEFHEKLQELRKERGLTQEELAEALYVSRTAISKWESGRGYPSIDSLKEISSFFSVSIDDLLSGERLISIAEKENKTNIQNMSYMLGGIVDVCSFMMILLPLYPNLVDGYFYSVNLLHYVQKALFNRLVFWGLYLSLIVIGIIKITLAQLRIEKGQKPLTRISLGISILTVLFLSMAGETYAVSLAFLLLIMKVVLIFKALR